MFRKYEKTYRIQVPQFHVKGKHHLTKDEVSNLLAAEVIVEEKLDGANTGIIRHGNGFKLQKRGSLVDQSEHAQFKYFHAWSNSTGYDSIMSVPKGHIVYGELMYATHSVVYDRLPDYFICFEVWTGDRYLDREEREDFCGLHGFEIAPLITRGIFTVDELYDLIPEQSAFGSTRPEGIVVKRYRTKKKERLWGKLVLPEFIKTMEAGGHWTKQALKVNKLAV